MFLNFFWVLASGPPAATFCPPVAQTSSYATVEKIIMGVLLIFWAKFQNFPISTWLIYLTFWCITSFTFRVLMWQTWVCAYAAHTCACNMCINSSFVIGCSGGFIITAHTSPHLFCGPTVVVHNSHTIKSESFLACFMRILNSCVVSKFQTVKPGCPPSQPHTFSARLLFDETAVQPDVFAFMNCPAVALNVFYSTVSMRSFIFLQSWNALT